MKKKILRVLGIILILFIIFCVWNFSIIKKSEKLLYEFRMNSNHYFVRCYGTVDNVMEIFYKDGKAKVVTRTDDEKNPVIYWEQYGQDDNTTQIMLLEGTKQFTVLESPFNIGLHGNIPYNYSFMLVNPYYTDKGEFTWAQKLLIPLMYSICPVIPKEYNGVKCYEINYNMGLTKIAKIYIDRETFLPIASIDCQNGGIVENYITKVGIVTDEDVTMPDISEYSQYIQEEN